MKLDIYDHFHPDEREFVDRAWEWVVHAGEYHEVKLTDFWTRGRLLFCSRW